MEHPPADPFDTARRAAAAIRWQAVDFDTLAGWDALDFKRSFLAFVQSAQRMAHTPYKTRLLGADAMQLRSIGNAALEMNGLPLSQVTCRTFFETRFAAHRMLAGDAASSHAFDGFVTGYFEPELNASLDRTDQFAVPIYRRPPDLVEFSDDNRPDGLPPGFLFARKTASGVEPYPDRAAIDDGALAGRGLELAWVESEIDLFFAQIQGSARLMLTDGSTRRIAYDGKSGHPFTAIGKLLIERGALDAATISMQQIRDWLLAHPEQARPLMHQNRSYIFFKEAVDMGAGAGDQLADENGVGSGPVAAGDVALTPHISLAVDRRLHTFGTPILVETKDALPGERSPFANLMIAQDTGSAIIGPARGDLFMGSGETAGLAAGAIKHAARFTVLLPR